ncbi:MAG: HAMP domain-containing protein [Acidobacteria bacterium]|nr:HAMP domain-containing protein [Acidobacteriota bacterium]
MKRQALAWIHSLHAKLFLVTAAVTSLLTIGMVYSITKNNRLIIEQYTKTLALETCEVVKKDILERDPEFKDPRKIETVLESIAGERRSIFQVDIFHLTREGLGLISSGDEAQVTHGPEVEEALRKGIQKAELVPLTTGNRAWEILYPIPNPRAGRPPLALIRTYCDLERWEVVWTENLHRTLNILPWVLLGEFILLWVIMAAFVNDPLRNLTQAMDRLAQGDPEARAPARRDELGLIADRFNTMAQELQRVGADREALLEEVRGLNAGLQERIDAALAEVASLMEGNALLREELSQQERLAVAGQLTAAFAHEVGTPLNLVNGHLQLLLGQPEIQDRTRERLEVIAAQIKRVGDIVRRLLDMTRRPQLNQEPVALPQLVEDLERLWSPTLAAHRVTFALEAPRGVELNVDRKQMEQLFINLVNNAVDAMPDGGSIRLRVRPDRDAPEGQTRWGFELEDTGAGISPENLPKIFKPMFTTKPEGKGTGLGLPICREIIRNHGGEIRMESEVGRGSRAIFSLPGRPSTD